ncbi:MAG: hypothetical protein R3183_14290 [Oleiphilaceae bacterium]|nr:hypothetical protein [Oleiphilaceae bacterium]
MKASNKTPAAQQAHYFKYFVMGAITFLLGIGTVVYVNLLLPASAQQEWLALAGLVLGVPGGLLAFYCYVRLLIARFQHFFKQR